MDIKREKDCIINEQWMKTPDMGEYLDNKSITEMSKKISEQKIDAPYFMEAPFSKELGYHEKENAFVISCKPNSIIDGDTVKIKYQNIHDGEKGFIFLGDNKKYDNVKKFLYQTLDIPNTSNNLSLRLIGINAPEVPHCRLTYVKENPEIVYAKYENLLSDSMIKVYKSKDCNLLSLCGSASERKNFSFIDYEYETNIDGYEVYPKNISERKNDSIIKFLEVTSEKGTKVYYEIMKENCHQKIEKDIDLPVYAICYLNGPDPNSRRNIKYHEQALKARDTIKDLLKKAKDVYFVLDGSCFKHQKNEIPFEYRSETDKLSSDPIYGLEFFYNTVTGKEKSYTRLGYDYFGQDYNKRTIAAMYILYDDEQYGPMWLNVSKYIAAMYNEVKTLPAYTSSPDNESNFNYNSSAFKLWTYDKSKQAYIDGFEDFYNEMGGDDRDKVQRKITNCNIDSLSEYSVMIGDCLLMIPPTSIRLVSQNTSQRTSLLRAKGTVTKTLPKTERIIEMQLFFNGDAGINGIPYEQELPNGETMIFYMNGLRSLIAQFKYTPYLPITNKYINQVLNIEAVSLNNIQINTLPNFPRTIQATIRLQDFEYKQFMPEIMPPDAENEEDLTTNLFAKTIHFPVMRYYYQRAIQRGEDLKLLDFNSEPYEEATLGQKAAIQPMKFESPLVEFFVANEEHLKMRKQLKDAIEKKPFETVVKYTNNEKNFLKEIAKMNSVAMKTLYDCDDNIKDINNSYNKDTDFYVPFLSDLLISLDNKESKDYLLSVFKENNITGFKVKKDNKTMKPEDYYNEYINPLADKLKLFFKDKSIFDYSIIKDYDIICREYKISNDSIKILYGLKIKIDWSKGGPELLRKIKQDYGKAFAVNTNILLKDESFTIGFSASVEKDGTKYKFNELFSNVDASSGNIDDTNADTCLLSKIANDFGLITDKDGNVEDDDIIGDDLFSKNENLADMKDNIDLESTKSIKFDKYPIENLIVENVSIVYSNNFVKMSLSAMEGYVSQYIGAADTVIELNMKTRDETTVTNLQALPKLCVDRLINYRKIMTCSPLRINSEITKMFGTNEVIIESIDINTVPNHPGLYDISLRLMSVDRTLRNKEALKKIDINNAHYNNDNTLYAKNFFDLKDTLKKVELYPDLELPTISELERLGYYFIRYKNQDGRIFPDADFYFVYLHPCYSEMIKQSIVSFFNDSNNSELIHEISGDLCGSNKTIAFNLDKDKKDLYHEKDSNSNDDENKQIEELYKKAEQQLSGSAPYATTEALNDINNIDKQNIDKQQLILDLQENLEMSNFNTYDFNHQIKISVKDNIPFNETTHNISQGKIKIFNNNNKLEEQPVQDIHKEVTKTLKKMIKNILSKQIIENKDTKIIISKEITELINYLTEDILLIPKGKAAYSVYSDNNKTELDTKENMPLSNENVISNSVFNFINNVLKTALSSAATGKKAILDVDLNNTSNYVDDWIGTSIVQFENENGEKDYLRNVLKTSNGQGLSNYTMAENIEDGIVFGPYAIKKYDASYIGTIYGTPLTSGKYGFLDPYYNKDVFDLFFYDEIKNGEIEAFDKSEEDDRIKKYINGITDESWYNNRKKSDTSTYATIAMFRILLIWFYKLLNDEKEIFLPETFYSLRNVSILMDKDIDTNFGEKLNNALFSKFNPANGLQRMGAYGLNYLTSFLDEDNSFRRSAEIQKENLDYKDELDHEFEETEKELKKGLIINKVNLVCGLFMTLGALAIGEFNTPIYSSLSGNLEEYSSYIEKMKSTYLDYENLNETELAMRRYFARLDFEEYKNKNNWQKFINPLKKYSNASTNQRVYLKAADIPAIYIMHSFYDMVMHDMRGRMARAFPTYYMLLIDEGRELGMWHLQDNFYNVSSISEFQVVNSRKIAASTATIMMTNLFGTFTSEDEDMKDEYQYTFKDAWNSIFSPRPYYIKEYNRRKNAREFNRAKLKPGARVHLRMGYEGDASRIPIIFNGSVAEVQPVEDLINIICQGDGVELANPDMFNPSDADDVADMKYSEDMLGGIFGLFNNNTTPRDLLINPLISSGTWIKSVIKDWSNSRFFNDNPFGIVHFGDKYFKDIFQNNGEMEQNIYEALNKPTWGTSGETSFNESLWSMETAPQIKVGLENGKSYWDLMGIAASVSPDFISAIAPFQLRSTIFYGAPRYYYAYDYEKDSTGKTIEKRKPFQQYHIYTSNTDIIKNNITASDKNIRTCAVGVYQGPGLLTSSTKTVGPMYVDIDIYPENQKMTTINCNFEYRNTNLPFTIPVIDKLSDDLSKNGGYQIAWRATANGLKDTVKDMYGGDLIIMGDPSIKPWDKMMIYDIYNDMQGITDVETTINTFSVETGFTTTITPDCVVAIDDKYEKVAHSIMKEVLLPATINQSMLCLLSAKFSNITRSLFFSASQAAKSGVEYSEKIMNGVKNIIGSEDMATYGPMADKLLGKLAYGFNATNSDYLIYSSISSISKAYDKMSIAHDSFKNSSDVVNFFSDIKNRQHDLEKINPNKLKQQLEEALSNTTSDKKRKEIEQAILDADQYIKNYNEASKLAQSVSIESDEIKAILEAIKGKESEIPETIEYLTKISNSKITANSKEFETAMSHIQIAASKIDDLGEDAKILKTLEKIETRIFEPSKKALNGFEKIEDVFKNINKIKKGAGSIKAAVATNALWFAAQIVITKYAQEYIERKLKNLQVLTIFPLMKNNLVMTAGLNGNKGSVFDSPTYNEPGFLEETAIKFFDNKYSYLLDLFIGTDEMRNIVSKYKRDSDYGTINGSIEVKKDQFAKTLLTQVIKNEVSSTDAYRQLFLKARIGNPSNDDGKLAYKENCLIDIKDPSTDKKIEKNLIYIFQDSYLKKFNSPEDKDKRVLLFSAQQEINAKDKNGNDIGTCDLRIASSSDGCKDMVVKCKKIEKGDKELPTYDIPFLRADAIIVLKRIIEETIKTLQPDADSENSTFENLHKHNIIIHNCTRINEKKSWFNTGYSFTIQVKDYNNFGNILQTLYEQQEVIIDDDTAGKLFNYKKDGTMGDNTYIVMVSPEK